MIFLKLELRNELIWPESCSECGRAGPYHRNFGRFICLDKPLASVWFCEAKGVLYAALCQVFSSPTRLSMMGIGGCYCRRTHWWITHIYLPSGGIRVRPVVLSLALNDEDGFKHSWVTSEGWNKMFSEGKDWFLHRERGNLSFGIYYSVMWS